MKEYIKEILTSYLSTGEDISDIQRDFYECEENFKHCDRTTGQRVYTEEEIEELVTEVLHEGIEVRK
jgi:hypothetical protein